MDGISGKLDSRHYVKIKVGNWHTKRKSGGCGVQQAGCSWGSVFGHWQQGQDSCSYSINVYEAP